MTVCGTSQSRAVNVSIAGDTVPSAVLLDETGTKTSAAGFDVSTTVKLTDVPDSDVVVPVGVPTTSGG